MLSRIVWARIVHNMYKGSLICKPHVQILFLPNTCRDTHVAGPNSGAIERLTAHRCSPEYFAHAIHGEASCPVTRRFTLQTLVSRVISLWANRVVNTLPKMIIRQAKSTLVLHIRQESNLLCYLRNGRRASRQRGFPYLAQQTTETKARVKYNFVGTRNMREAGFIVQSSEREKATRRRRSSSGTQTTPWTNAGQQGKSVSDEKRRRDTKKQRKRRDEQA